MLELDPNISMEELESFLEKGEIPYKTWHGIAGAKSIEQLWEEISSRKSKIQYEEEGTRIVNVERHVNSVLLDVRCFPRPDLMLGLHVDMERLKDARMLRHNITATGKVSSTQQTAVRECLLEKLGFDGKSIFIHPRTEESPVMAARRCSAASQSNAASFIVVKGRFDQMEESDTFPGIPSLRDLWQFLCVIPLDAYRPDHAIEQEHGDIKIVCTWRSIAEDTTDMSAVRME